MSPLFAAEPPNGDAVGARVEIGVPDPAEPLLRAAALNSPVLKEQELRVAQADAFRFRGWRQHMPYVYANWQAGYFSLLSSNDPDTKAGNGQFGGNFTLGAHYPIYAWGAIEAEKKFAFARERVAKNRALIVWRQLARDIRHTFLEAVILKARIAGIEKRRTIAAQATEIAKKQFSLGRISKSDRTARELDARNQELEISRKKIELTTLLTKIRGYTGDEDFSAAKLPDTLPDIVWDDAAMAAAFASHGVESTTESPETRLVGDYSEQLDNQRIMIEARDLPTFNIGANITQSPVQTAGGFGMQTYLFFGITGAWTIFDRDTTAENVRSLAFERRFIESRANIEKKNRRDELETALTTLKIRRAGHDLRLEIKKLRTEALAVAQERRKLGLATEIDEAQASADLLDAHLSLMIDRADILNAYHDFMSGIELASANSLYSAPDNE